MSEMSPSKERRRDADDLARRNYLPPTVLGTRLIAEIRWLAATGRWGRVAELNWTIRLADGITAASILEPARPHETVSAQAIHMVERADLWHTIVDMAVRRTGRRRRAGQPVLPHPRPQDRSVAWLRAALGDLQRLCRGDTRAAVVARLAASHRRCPADRRDLQAA